jgi:heptosyltransferase-2
MRIVVIRFSSLGDCVLLCPLLEHLKRAGAGEVVVVTRRDYAELFAAARGADRVLAIDRRDSPLASWRAGRAFRGPDCAVIDAHASARSRLLSLGAGRVRSRIAKHTRARLGLVVFKRPASLPTMLERYARLAREVGVETPALAPGGIAVPAPAARAAAHAMGEAPFVAVSPGSRWSAKQWPGFTPLCETLASAQGYRVLLVGDRRDRAAAAPIAASLGHRALDLTGQATLMETAAHIARCRAFVGNDSGLMHLSEAVGVPVVALFGPTVREFGYYPSLARSRTVERRLPCRPCSKNGAAPCPRATGECLGAILPDTVADAVATLFDDAAPRRIVVD